MYGAYARKSAYDAKVDPATLLSDLEAAETQMKAEFAAVVPTITAMELQVKQVCDGAGVTTIQIPFYLCFGRELWKLGRQSISGETAAINAAMQLAKWVGRGLTGAVLQAIRTDVFNIAAPLA